MDNGWSCGGRALGVAALVGLVGCGGDSGGAATSSESRGQSQCGQVGQPCCAEFAGCFDDGDACNGVEVCNDQRICAHVSPVTCAPPSPCHAGGCDPLTGACRQGVLADGTECGGAGSCNGAGVCRGGVCVAGGALDCDDGNPCTNDSCSGEFGCVHVSVRDGTPCGSLDACHAPSRCSGGECVDGAPVDCDDGNPCTADSCDPRLGCMHALITGGACGNGGGGGSGGGTCDPGMAGIE
jgi:hypothetical protein